MARYSDEAWEHISDSIDKKITARSARNTRTHCGKGGAVKLPSDYMSKKEIKAMNGECKSYRMNKPMTWEEFKTMPDDLKIEYVKMLRKKFGVPDSRIADMFGVVKATLHNHTKALGLSKGSASHGDGRKYWDKEGWLAWCNSAEQAEEIPVEEDLWPDNYEEEAFEQESSVETPDKNGNDETKAPIYNNLSSGTVPDFGELNYTGYVPDILKHLHTLLGDSNVAIQVKWNIMGE